MRNQKRMEDIGMHVCRYVYIYVCKYIRTYLMYVFWITAGQVVVR